MQLSVLREGERERQRRKRGISGEEEEEENEEEEEEEEDEEEEEERKGARSRSRPAPFFSFRFPIHPTDGDCESRCASRSTRCALSLLSFDHGAVKSAFHSSSPDGRREYKRHKVGIDAANGLTCFFFSSLFFEKKKVSK